MHFRFTWLLTSCCSWPPTSPVHIGLRQPDLSYECCGLASLSFWNYKNRSVIVCVVHGNCWLLYVFIHVPFHCRACIDGELNWELDYVIDFQTDKRKENKVDLQNIIFFEVNDGRSSFFLLFHVRFLFVGYK